jgi:mono/diheme cytochrome c family protein
MQNSASTLENKPAATTDAEYVQRGEYLVNMIGCNDCHSPKKMGERGPEVIQELKLSGYPASRPLQKVSIDALSSGWGLLNADLTSFAGPWGQSFAANLTPDPSGIGNWTEQQFKLALTRGWFKGIEGSRMLLPPMPWQNWTTMKDEDVKAIYMYLMSLPPVKNEVPEPIPPDVLMAVKK